MELKFYREDLMILPTTAVYDHNDQKNAWKAIQYSAPEYFSEMAKDCLEYFEGSLYIFEYKGQLHITDESMELTDFASPDGKYECWGGPRLICDSWDELQDWLETVWEDLDEDEQESARTARMRGKYSF